MKAPSHIRTFVLASSLALTLVLVFNSSMETSESVGLVDAVVSRPVSHTLKRNTNIGDVAVKEFPVFDAKAPIGTAETTLLQPTSWWVPAPTIPQPIISVEPQGPPILPFQYRGILLTHGNVAAVIEKQGEQSTVHVGDVLDSIYRVEDIAVEGISLTYLPLNIKQIVTMQDEK